MTKALRAPGKKDKILGAIRPDKATQEAYKARLLKALANMQASYTHWVSLRYGSALTENQQFGRLPDADEPLAQDAASARNVKQRTSSLFAELLRLRTYWERHFDELAQQLAEQALDSWYEHNARAWHGTLKRAGFDIEMQLTPSQRLILRAKVQENVALIKSIQQQYHTEIEGLVLRSFTAGRDLASLAEALTTRYGATKRRAAFIARDQANKATADMNSARQRELGLQWAVWIHSAAGKEPRKNHVRAGREQWVFNTQQGVDFHDGFGHVLPGQAINCFPGDSVVDFAAGCKRLWRRRYSGELTCIITASGKTFRATPNHPILTRRGWVAARSLDLGDEVVNVRRKVVGTLKADVEHDVPMFDELFNTAASCILPARVAGIASQFHGDGSASDVDVVDIDRFLPDVFDAACCKQLAELLFADADAAVYAAQFGSDGTLSAGLQAMTFAPDFVIRGASALLTLLKRGTGCADDIGLRLIAWLHTLFQQTAADDISRNFVPFAEFKFAHAQEIISNELLIGQLLNVLTRAASCWQRDTASADELANRARVQTDDSCGLLDALPAFEQFDRVIDLRSVDFDGHVYNLESALNWYSVSTCIVHNCRCISRSIIPALGRGDIEGPQDLDAISGFPGAYRAKPGKSVEPKPTQKP